MEALARGLALPNYFGAKLGRAGRLPDRSGMGACEGICAGAARPGRPRPPVTEGLRDAARRAGEQRGV